MPPRTEPVRTIRYQPDAAPSRRSRLDWAILAAVVALGALNLYALAGHFDAGTAHAATLVRACGISPA